MTTIPSSSDITGISDAATFLATNVHLTAKRLEDRGQHRARPGIAGFQLPEIGFYRV